MAVVRWKEGQEMSLRTEPPELEDWLFHSDYYNTSYQMYFIDLMWEQLCNEHKLKASLYNNNGQTVTAAATRVDLLL